MADNVQQQSQMHLKVDQIEDLLLAEELLIVNVPEQQLYENEII